MMMVTKRPTINTQKHYQKKKQQPDSQALMAKSDGKY